MPGTRTQLQARLSRLKSEHKNTMLAFAVPALILLIGFLTRGVFPIADRNILTIDLYHQYAPFMAELQEKFRSGGSLFYSWSGGLGTNFYALFAYYLASPLNILIVLFPKSLLTEAIMLLVLLKTGLAGACFFLFLRGVWRQSNLYMVAVASLYALSAYSLAYYWNIMWLDGIFLLPLIMLGLVQLVRDKKFWLYTISLGLVIFSNYYIAFFVCIFTFFYFLLCLFQFRKITRPAALFASVGRFIAFSLLGAGLAAFLALPTYFSLQLTSAAGDSIPKDINHFYDLFDFIKQHFILMPPTIRDGMPNMYSGIIVLVLVPVFFLAKSVSLKSKFLHLGLFLVLLVSFNVNILDFFWHGMHYPNQLPYRNSFVYIFFILTMAYPALLSLKEYSGKQIGAICAAGIGLVLLTQKLDPDALGLPTLYLTLIFLAVYAAVLTLDRVKPRVKLPVLILAVIIVELLVNTLVTLHTIDVTEVMSWRNGYMSGEQVQQIRTDLKEIRQEEDGDFYRLEVLPPRTINDPFMYQYRGVSIFASTMQTKPVRLLENLGFHSNSINSYKYEASTLLLDSLFGLKYILRRSGEQDYQLFNLVKKTDQLEVWQNPYALGLGFLGSQDLAKWRSSGNDPFKSQNRLMELLSGQEQVLVPLKLERGELDNMTYSSSSNHVFSYKKTNSDQEAIARVNVINELDQHIYLYFSINANKADRGYVMLDEDKIDYNAKRSTVVDLGFVSAGTEIVFNITFDGESAESGRFELYACGLDANSLGRAVETIRDNSLQIEKFTDTKQGYLFLTIPYDTGWQAKVDGQQVATEALDNGLTLLPLEAGQHEIELKYRPPKLMWGVLISLVSLAVLLLLAFFSRRQQRQQLVETALEQNKAGVRPVLLGQPDENPDN